MKAKSVAAVSESYETVRLMDKEEELARLRKEYSSVERKYAEIANVTYPQLERERD